MICSTGMIATLSKCNINSRERALGKCWRFLNCLLSLKSIIIFIDIIISMSAGCAGQPADLKTPLKTPKLTGQIVDNDGKFASGVSVSLLPFGWHVETNAQGKFSFADQISEIDKGGKIPRLFVLARYSSRNMGAIAEVKDTSSPLSLRLSPTNTVRVRIVDPEGRPIPDAKAIVVVKTTKTEWNDAVFDGHKAIADKDGQAVIPAIPSSPSVEYTVHARAKGYGVARMEYRLQPGGHCETMTLWPANTYVGGIVLDSTNRPVTNAKVFIDGDDQRQPYRETTTSSSGQFWLNNLCSGKVPVAIFSHDGLWYGSDELDAGRNDNTVYMRRLFGMCVPPGEIHSLAGHLLPTMKDLGVSLEQDSFNKRILVCFWTMYQQPSRDAIRKLSAMKEYLSRHRVYTVFIDIFATNEKQVQAWAARNNVSYEISLLPKDVTDDHVKIVRFSESWGVRNRLPWLILTDRNHKVQQEGCSIDRMKEILDNE